MVAKKKDIEQTLRQALLDSGLSIYRLSKETGVSQPQLCRFVNGRRGITLETAARLAAALDLELCQKRRKGR